MFVSGCLYTVCATLRRRRLSGGERKRLSLASEMLSKPAVLFADEPTSGLDSFLAEEVVAKLAEVAAAGCTVVCSIHTPRVSSFARFTKVQDLAAEPKIKLSLREKPGRQASGCWESECIRVFLGVAAGRGPLALLRRAQRCSLVV